MDSPSAVPSTNDLRDAYNLELQAADGSQIRFGDLVLQKGEVTTVVVFIRHFFCFYDQDYVRSASQHLTDSVLNTIPSAPGPVQLIIIGCGDPSLIVPYVNETGAKDFPVYSDPEGKLYEKLHMRKTLAGITSPSDKYTGVGFWRSLGGAMKQVLGRGWSGLKGGRWDQNGGEWVFRDGKVQFSHRMESVDDHLSTGELLEVLEGRRKE